MPRLGLGKICNCCNEMEGPRARGHQTSSAMAACVTSTTLHCVMVGARTERALGMEDDEALAAARDARHAGEHPPPAAVLHQRRVDERLLAYRLCQRIVALAGDGEPRKAEVSWVPATQPCNCMGCSVRSVCWKDQTESVLWEFRTFSSFPLSGKSRAR